MVECGGGRRRAYGGSSELVTLLLGWLMLAASGVSLVRRQGYQAGIWASLLAMLTSSAVLVMVAPSNVHRLQPATADLPGIVAQLAHFWQPNWLAKALQRFFFRPSTAFLVVFPLLLASLRPALVAMRPRGLHLPLGVSAGILLGAFLLQLEVAGPDLASRCANVLVWWLLLGWLVACWAALPLVLVTATPSRWSNQVVRYSFAALLVVFLAAPVRRAWHEVLVDAPAWQQQCRERYTLLQRLAKTTPHVNVQVLPIRAVVPHYVLIRGYDIATSYNYPYNRDMAAYFGVDSVRVHPKARNAAF
jgi:hypothetical protein